MKIYDLSNVASLGDEVYLKAFDSILNKKTLESRLQLRYKSVDFFPKTSLNLDSYPARMALLQAFSLPQERNLNEKPVIKIKYFSDFIVLRKKLGNTVKFVGIGRSFIRSFLSLIRPFSIFIKAVNQAVLCLAVATVYTRKRSSKIRSIVYGYVSDTDFNNGRYTERYRLCQLLSSPSSISIYVPLLPNNSLLTPIRFAKSQGELALFREREIGLIRLILADIRLVLLMYYRIIKASHPEAISHSFSSSFFEAVKNIEFVSRTIWETNSTEVALWNENQDHQNALVSAMECRLGEPLVIMSKSPEATFVSPESCSILKGDIYSVSGLVVKSAADCSSYFKKNLFSEVVQPFKLLVAFTATHSINMEIVDFLRKCLEDLRSEKQLCLVIRSHPNLDVVMFDYFKKLTESYSMIIEYSLNDIDWDSFDVLICRNSSIQEEAHRNNKPCIIVCVNDFPMLTSSYGLNDNLVIGLC